MICPKCDHSSLAKTFVRNQNFEVDRCKRCNGLWVKLDDLQTILSVKEEKELMIPSYSMFHKNINCPSCKTGLYEFCYPETIILIDACKLCDGVWLDSNEWKEINTVKNIANQIYCPSCCVRQPKSETCVNCGIIFSKQKSKISTNKKQPTIRPSIERRSYADNIPGIKGQILRFIDSSIENLTNY